MFKEDSITHLPDTIGEPAPPDIKRKERFVSVALALKERVPRLLEWLDNIDQLDTLGTGLDMLRVGHLPNYGGLVRAGDKTVVAFNMQAGFTHEWHIVLGAQRKGDVSKASKKEGKVPHSPGLVVASKIDLDDLQRDYDATVSRLIFKIFGVAFNPDSDPWLADRYGIDDRFGRNEHGIVIAHAPDEILHRQYVPVRLNDSSGETIIA